MGIWDSVVNSAGATFIGNLEETSTELFKKQFDINVIGTIVNIASDLGIKPIPERIAYCASKAAVIMLTKSIAIEYAPLVRANCILPELVKLPIIKVSFNNVEIPQKLEKEMPNWYVLKELEPLNNITNPQVFLKVKNSVFLQEG